MEREEIVNRVADAIEELTKVATVMTPGKVLTSDQMVDVENWLDDAKDAVKAAVLVADKLARDIQKAEGY